MGIRELALLLSLSSGASLEAGGEAAVAADGTVRLSDTHASWMRRAVLAPSTSNTLKPRQGSSTRYLQRSCIWDNRYEAWKSIDGSEATSYCSSKHSCDSSHKCNAWIVYNFDSLVTVSEVAFKNYGNAYSVKKMTLKYCPTGTVCEPLDDNAWASAMSSDTATSSWNDISQTDLVTLTVSGSPSASKKWKLVLEETHGETGACFKEITFKSSSSSGSSGTYLLGDARATQARRGRGSGKATTLTPTTTDDAAGRANTWSNSYEASNSIDGSEATSFCSSEWSCDGDSSETTDTFNCNAWIVYDFGSSAVTVSEVDFKNYGDDYSVKRMMLQYKYNDAWADALTSPWDSISKTDLATLTVSGSPMASKKWRLVIQQAYRQKGACFKEITFKSSS